MKKTIQMPESARLNDARKTGGRYAGIVPKVEALLSDHVPRNSLQIEAAFPEFTENQIKGAVRTLLKRRPTCVVNIGTSRRALYQIPVPKINSAAPRRVREFKPMRRDPFEAMRLAMLTR